MDDRTRRADIETAPEFRRTAPVPIIETRRGRRSRLVVGLVILIAVLLGGYLIFRSSFSTHPAPNAGHNAQAPPQPIGAATVGQGDIRVIVNALGTVTPLATVTVQTQIDGQLLEVGFTEGQIVKQGDFREQTHRRPYTL